MDSIDRDSLNKALSSNTLSPQQKEIAALRLRYSKISTIKGTVMPWLENYDRLHSTILPTQKSGRWSYIDPNLNSFPKRCINPSCPKEQHRKTKDCWSIRDCLLPDKNTFWIEHDLDSVEHRIYSLFLGWQDRIDALINNLEIHTPVTCGLFKLPLPKDPYDPHNSPLDEEWRTLVNWQGKDDQRRTMSKNFTYGGQYFFVEMVSLGSRTKQPNFIYKKIKYNPSFVYSIPNLETFRIENDKGELVPPDFIQLAINFVESNYEIQCIKAEAMARIARDRIARTLYGGRRVFFDSSQETAKQGFNFVMQGTVASYTNESVILLNSHFKDSYLIQNHHDSLKWSFPYQSITEKGRKEEEQQVLNEVKRLTQRELTYNNKTMPITATYSIKTA